MLPVVILAGGRGTRLASVTGDATPKAMVRVAGRPFIDHKLDDLAARGVRDVVLLVGHRGEILSQHVGDGSHYGLRVRSLADGRALRGTAGAIVAARSLLPDAFWVTYGDTLLDVDLSTAEARFREHGRPALMTVLRNRDRFEPSNVVVRSDAVLAYAKDPRPVGAEFIDYGMLAFERAVFDGWAGDATIDLAEVLGELVARGAVTAFEVTERFHDIGTVDALRETERYLRAHG